MTKDTSRIEITRGDKRAVFLRRGQCWKPDWFYQGDRPMLRFKDHEWLSVGHVHPAFASSAKKVRGGGVEFAGRVAYGQTEVAWTVRVAPDPLGLGFSVECALRPKKTIELLEAYSTFETPYEYDGTETVTTVIGQNPVSLWRGNDQISPPIWKHPAWVYSRPQAVRITGPCNTPYLCQAVTTDDAKGNRFTTLVGDWNVCQVRDVYVTPTRTVRPDAADRGDMKRGERRGYKFIVGALNWSSAFAKDPNVLFEGGKVHRQRLTIDFEGRMPGGSLDRMLLAAWQGAAHNDFPAHGRIEAFDRAKARGVTWAKAAEWLRDVFCEKIAAAQVFRPADGINVYADGTRPKAGGHSWFWWPQWAGGLHYRALVTGDPELAAACEKWDAEFARRSKDYFYHGETIGMSITVVPALWWLHGSGSRSGPLADAFRDLFERTLEHSVAENGKVRKMDDGCQAVTAEGFLLGSKVFAHAALAAQAEVLLGEVNANLDDRFWEFGVGDRANLMHGGQIRPMGHGHAALANYLAWRMTRRPDYLAAAQRFGRTLIAIHYVTHNHSADPDFDWRGWANGTNGGRDQYAEFPPWETSNSLLALAPMMEAQDLEPAWHDVLWYFARTGLAQFPAARTLKRILDESMEVRYVPRRKIASERDFYDTLPYLAYENPHDQTLLAPYQGTDCLLGELVFGGGLAWADDDRLGVVVPRAATMAASETSERLVRLWNPTGRRISTRVTVRWPDGRTARQRAAVPPRSSAKLVFTRQ